MLMKKKNRFRNSRVEEEEEEEDRPTARGKVLLRLASVVNEKVKWSCRIKCNSFALLPEERQRGLPCRRAVRIVTWPENNPSAHSNVWSQLSQLFSDDARRPTGESPPGRGCLVPPPLPLHSTKCSVTALWRAVANKLTPRGRRSSTGTPLPSKYCFPFMTP